jgi:NAD(P)-dependent dehydrogenase (short-subunit alcohol dehydrogenase family)
MSNQELAIQLPPPMRTIVVTGASTGIGFATAASLARAGHDVFATMRNPSRAPELQNLAKAEGLPITVVALDVNDEASVKSGFKHVVEARGRVDVLVNNAGVGHLGSVEETPIDLVRKTMETNFFGALRCLQAVLPGMRRQQSGHIINISSVAGRLASAGQSAYCASKFALEALSEALATEMRPFNVRVSIVEPGVIETPIFGKSEQVASNAYPGARRMNAVFAASLEQPVPASVIADQIRDIVAAESWQLRHPGGPDAAGILAWRASVTDEQAVSLGDLDDDAWCEVMESRGLNVRPYM